MKTEKTQRKKEERESDRGGDEENKRGLAKEAEPTHLKLGLGNRSRLGNKIRLGSKRGQENEEAKGTHLKQLFFLMTEQLR